MTLEEILQAAGLAEEKVAEVTAKLKENGIGPASSDAAALQEQVDSLTAKLKEYDGKTIDDGSKDAAIKELQKQLNREKFKGALTAAHARDVDYMLYKASADGTLNLEAENIEEAAFQTAVETLKTSYADQFGAAGAELPAGAKRIDPQSWTKEAAGKAEPETLKDALIGFYGEEK